jgi:hypothetical protein
MNDFIRQLRHQEKLHRKSGANGLADLFMNAAKELEQHHEELERLRNPWISVEDELPEIENKNSDWLLVRNSKNKVPFVARLINWPDMDEPEWQTNGGGIAVVDEWSKLPKEQSK